MLFITYNNNRWKCNRSRCLLPDLRWCARRARRVQRNRQEHFLDYERFAPLGRLVRYPQSNATGHVVTRRRREGKRRSTDNARRVAVELWWW